MPRRKKKNILNNPEHIERTLLRPTAEEFCLQHYEKNGFEEYVVKEVEFCKDNVGRAKIFFFDQDGESTEIDLTIKVYEKTEDGKTRKMVSFRKKPQKRKKPNSDDSE